MAIMTVEKRSKTVNQTKKCITNDEHTHKLLYIVRATKTEWGYLSLTDLCSILFLQQYSWLVHRNTERRAG